MVFECVTFVSLFLICLMLIYCRYRYIAVDIDALEISHTALGVRFLVLRSLRDRKTFTSLLSSMSMLRTSVYNETFFKKSATFDFSFIYIRRYNEPI
jgi:hypothetical protein